MCWANQLLMIKWTKNKWQKFKEWSSVDHWIDLFVDVGLIAFDVLSSPILIVVRFIRFFFNRYILFKTFIPDFICNKVCWSFEFFYPHRINF